MTASDCITERRSIRHFSEQPVDHSLLSSLVSVIMGIFDREAATPLLELPAGRELVAFIALGYADEEPVAPARKPVSELLIFKS